jgi:hypothetical protein
LWTLLITAVKTEPSLIPPSRERRLTPEGDGNGGNDRAGEQERPHEQYASSEDAENYGSQL